MDRDRTPRPGELYRHFKNRLYQVIGVAEHTETGERLVIYQALYGTYGVYARPLEMFTGEVDREKYPDASQRYRFEKIERDDGAGLGSDPGNRSEYMSDQKDGRRETCSGWETDAEKAGKLQKEIRKTEEETAEKLSEGVQETEQDDGKVLNPLLLSFIESEDFCVKLEILAAMEGKVSQEDLDMLCEAMDLPRGAGDVESQIHSVRQYLEMRRKFDGNRLR